MLPLVRDVEQHDTAINRSHKIKSQTNDRTSLDLMKDEQCNPVEKVICLKSQDRITNHKQIRHSWYSKRTLSPMPSLIYLAFFAASTFFLAPVINFTIIVRANKNVVISLKLLVCVASFQSTALVILRSIWWKNKAILNKQIRKWRRRITICFVYIETKTRIKQFPHFFRSIWLMRMFVFFFF